MEDYYILLLEDGNFVSYEKINNKEIEVCPVTWRFADAFPTLEDAENEVKAISNK